MSDDQNLEDEKDCLDLMKTSLKNMFMY